MAPAAALATIGHNNPPTLAEILAEKHESLLTEVNTVAVKANAAPKLVVDDSDLGTIADIVKGARQLAKRLDQARTAEKEPHLTAGREIDAFFKISTERLDRIAKVLEERATEYQRAKAAEERRRREEEARRLREEEERQREIARRAEEANRLKTAAKHEDKAEDAAERAAVAESAAHASAADLTRTRSSSGTVATARTTWEFEITNIDEIPLDKLRPYLPRADIEKAIRTYVRMGGRELAGVRIFEDVKASFR